MNQWERDVIEILRTLESTWQSYLDRPERMREWDFDGWRTYNQVYVSESLYSKGHELAQQIPQDENE